MFTILVEGPQGRQRFEMSTLPVTIGRDSVNALVLPHRAVDRQHARLELIAGKQVVIDQRSKSGTYVNGARVVARRVLEPDDKLTIGPYSLHIVPAVVAAPIERYDPADATEAALLDELAGGDPTSRLVYADWLEGRGDADRAELVRMQTATGTFGGGFDPRSMRLVELAERTDVAWRAVVARPPIEGCISFEYECPKDWGSLAPTEQPAVRYCNACEQAVHYCVDVPEARLYAKRGECVALDVRGRRWKDDLAEPFDQRMCPACDLDIGPAEHCPRCGSPARVQMMMRGIIVR